MAIQGTTKVLLAAAILAVLLPIAILTWPLPRRSTGMSLTYLGSKSYPGGATARFLTSNTTDRAALVYISGIEEHSNGVWSLRREVAVSPKKLLPQGSREWSLRAPTDVDKWRLRVAVQEERRGWAGFVARVRWFLGQARNGFRDGTRLPAGKIYDGDELISEEITKHGASPRN
jgi:hypothetical protein